MGDSLRLEEGQSSHTGVQDVQYFDVREPSPLSEDHLPLECPSRVVHVELNLVFGVEEFVHFFVLHGMDDEEVRVIESVEAVLVVSKHLLVLLL